MPSVFDLCISLASKHGAIYRPGQVSSSCRNRSAIYFCMLNQYNGCKMQINELYGFYGSLPIMTTMFVTLINRPRPILSERITTD